MPRNVSQAKTSAKTIVADLVRAWSAPIAGTAPKAVNAPVIRVQEVLTERGFDEPLHRARRASKIDPFALHLGLGRLAHGLLFGSNTGRPKMLLDLLVRLLPAKPKPPAAISGLLRALKRGDRASFAGIERDLASAALANLLFRAMFEAPLAAERVLDLACREQSIFYYPFLSQPDLSERLMRAADAEKPGTPAQGALFRALRLLDRYIVDVRARPLLLAGLGSPSPECRKLAASSLLTFASASAWPKERWNGVIALLDDEHAEVRADVSFALLAHRDHLDAKSRNAVANALERHLEDRSLEVRMRAVSGLSTLLGRAFLARARDLERSEKNGKMRLVLRRKVAELSARGDD